MSSITFLLKKAPVMGVMEDFRDVLTLQITEQI